MKTKPLVLLCPAVPKLGFIFIIENYTGMESEGTSGLGVVKNSPETAGKYVCTYISGNGHTKTIRMINN